LCLTFYFSGVNVYAATLRERTLRKREVDN
jgi:hypothetical protein